MEKYRIHDMQEQRGCRAVFTDLVTFVKIASSDPLFGNIQDLQPISHSKASDASHPKQWRKGSAFATSVNAVKEGNKIYTDNRSRSSPLLFKVTSNAVYFANKTVTHWINAHTLS